MTPYAFRGVAMGLALGIVAAASGAAAASSGATAAAGPIGAGLLAFAGLTIATWRLGLAAPLTAFTLTSVGAMPGLDNRATVTTGVDIGDCAVGAMVLVLLVMNASRPGKGARAPSDVRRVTALCALLLGWWTIEFLRTTIGGNSGPPLQAARYGRDFAYLAVLTPLFVGVFTDRTILRVLLPGLAAGAAIQALAGTARSFGVSGLGAIVHSINSYDVGPFQRVYTDAGQLIIVAGLFAIGGFLLARDKRQRRALAALAIVCLASVALGFGRANYLGVTFAVVVGTLLWSRNSLVRTRVAIVLCAVVTMATMLSAVAPDSRIALAATAVSERAQSLAVDAQDAGGGRNTVSYRRRLVRVMGDRLSAEHVWPQGLGFRSPSFDFDPNLPGGEIRNSDVGYMQVVMTMGLVGALLLYLPVVVALVVVVTRRPGEPALLFGSTASVLYVLSTSGSQSFLFSPPGTVLAAAILGIVFAAGATGQIRRDGVQRQLEGLPVSP